MARISKATDFTVKVDGVGTFTFGRRGMREEIDIQREYAAILDGVQPTGWLEVVGGWMSAFKVLTVRAPEGWDIEAMDPLDNDTYARMKRVYDALSDKELSFRRKPGADGEGSGAPAA